MMTLTYGYLRIVLFKSEDFSILKLGGEESGDNTEAVEVDAEKIHKTMMTAILLGFIQTL